MRYLEKILILGVLALFAALSLWLQIRSQEGTVVTSSAQQRHDPDYYIENFTATGMDERGNREYTLEAERLVHYPDDNTALLDKPHIIQYEPGKAPTHTYAESGWVSPDGDEILLTGKVRVIRGRGQNDGGGVMTTDKLRVRLKKGTLKKDS